MTERQTRNEVIRRLMNTAEWRAFMNLSPAIELNEQGKVEMEEARAAIKRYQKFLLGG